MDTQQIDRLDRIERMLALLAGKSGEQAYYSVKRFAELVGEATWTVRQKCNLGQLIAERALTRCGPCRQWRISHAELERYRREGNLPIKPDRNDPDRPDGHRKAS